jgi:hypothetical protein
MGDSVSAVRFWRQRCSWGSGIGHCRLLQPSPQSRVNARGPQRLAEGRGAEQPRRVALPLVLQPTLYGQQPQNPPSNRRHVRHGVLFGGLSAGLVLLSRVFLIAMVPTDERAVKKESPQGD